MPKASRHSNDAVRFGLIINRLRTQRRMTLIQLGRRSGMHPTYLGVLEKGGNMPSLETILRLAEIFKVSAGDIVREVEDARKEARAVPTGSPHEE